MVNVSKRRSLTRLCNVVTAAAIDQGVSPDIAARVAVEAARLLTAEGLTVVAET